eukprot:sb/3466451/
MKTPDSTISPSDQVEQYEMMTDYNTDRQTTDRQTESGLVEGGQFTDSLTDNNPFVSDKKCLTLEPPKLEQIKKWTITNYKYTKQLVGEKLGNTTKTVDKDTDERISDLKIQKLQFAAMLRESRALHTRFEALLTSHQLLRTQFNTMVAHAPELGEQLQANSTTHLILERNGKGLLGAIKSFVDSLNTLVNVTMQDTILTVKNYENARIEYDAYRNEVTNLQNAPQTDANKNKLLEIQITYDDRKRKWERLMQDTHTKMNLLNENKNTVMKQQLEMFNSAVIAYFSGNGEQLSDGLYFRMPITIIDRPAYFQILSEYHIKTRKLSGDDDATSKSFLARQE